MGDRLFEGEEAVVHVMGKAIGRSGIGVPVPERLFDPRTSVLHLGGWVGRGRRHGRFVDGGAPGPAHEATRALMSFRSESDTASLSTAPESILPR
jgi:hypothetical protein